ncbi:MAG: lasso peptide biosynthesis B2 protein [Bacteroidota bacterium]
MLKKISQLSKLPFKEIIYLFPAFLLLSVSKLAIVLLPFNFLQKYFQIVTQNHQHILVADSEIELKANSINRISSAFQFLKFSCLPKALALKFWLKKYEGISVNFGVQKDHQNQFIAHAWVSNCDKIILGDHPNINYKSIWVWK